MLVRRAISLLAPVLLVVGISAAPTAHAEVLTKGKVSATFTDDFGNNHYLASWMNVDYTNHRIRPYADHYTGAGSYKGVKNNFRKDCCSLWTAQYVSYADRLTVSAPSTFDCGGGHKWQVWGDFWYYDNLGRDVYRYVDSAAIQTAC